MILMSFYECRSWKVGAEGGEEDTSTIYADATAFRE